MPVLFPSPGILLDFISLCLDFFYFVVHPPQLIHSAASHRGCRQGGSDRNRDQDRVRHWEFERGVPWVSGLLFPVSFLLLRRATGWTRLDWRDGPTAWFFFSFSASEGYWDGWPEGGMDQPRLDFSFSFLQNSAYVEYNPQHTTTITTSIPTPSPRPTHKLNSQNTPDPPLPESVSCVCVSDRQTAARVIIDTTQPTRDSQGFKSRTER